MSALNSPFAPGADLWIIPERKSSKLVQKMDWYLNFQIAKSVQHQSQTLSQNVLEILKACALNGYDFAPDASADALMILSSQTLPNRWVMVLKGSDETESWFKTAATKWKKMNSPSIRLFLPQGLHRSEALKLWKRFGGDDSVHIIEEGDHGN